MKKLFAYILPAVLLMTLGMVISFAPPAYADDLEIPYLDINGAEIYNDTGVHTPPQEGVSFDLDTYTVTLNNVDLYAVPKTNFIQGSNFGNSQPKELHIVLIGDNVIKCSDHDPEYAEELIYYNGDVTIEGSGSLTVKNSISGLVDTNNANRTTTITIRDCTITSDLNSEYDDFINGHNLTLDGCTINTNYTYTPDNGGNFAYLHNRLVMKNATWNINAPGDADYGNGLDVYGGGEFHNSVFNVTGHSFYSIYFGPGEVIYDNATFLGSGKITGFNSTNNMDSTYHNFKTKHQYTDDYGNQVVLSGRYSSDDLYLVFPIVPYKSDNTPGTNTNPASTPVPTTPVNNNSANNNKPTKKKLVTKIKITAPSKSIAAGKSVQLKATVLPDDADNKKVTWKSSNKKIATVSSAGKVKFLKKTGGKKVTITAMAADGSGKKASVTLRSMKGIIKKIKITGKSSVKAGKTVKLKAKVTATAGAYKKVTWSSSNKKYASVNSSGKVNALKAGKGKTVKITAKALDGSGKKATFKLKIE